MDRPVAGSAHQRPWPQDDSRTVAQAFVQERPRLLPRSRYNLAQNDEETVAGRIENLKPWRPGQSGNPGGRPKRDLASELAAAVFENNSEAIYRAMLRTLTKGNPRVFAVLADRAYGTPKQQIEIDDSSSVVAILLAGRRRAFERNMTDVELQDASVSSNKNTRNSPKLGEPGMSAENEKRSLPKSER